MEDEGDDTKRRSRNLSEKKRRDQFNTLVTELSSMVSNNARKMDKSTVLKATIACLKSHNESRVRSRAHDIQQEWKPAFLSNYEFTHLILEALDGFIIVFSATGLIHFVSDSVTSLLGHMPRDLLNKSVFDLVYDDDRPGLYNLLQNPGTSVDTLQAVVLKENQIKFFCHIRRGGTFDCRDEPTYELVEFSGYFRTSVEPLETDDMMGYSQNHDTRILFVCTARLRLPQLIRDISLMDPGSSEFTSRHSLEWKYLFLDHRAPPIIGYLPFEVLGTSGYDYYHLDDLQKVVACHEALMQKGELTSCHYRFLTKGQQWIWLQSRFYITYHQWNSKPEFVVCTHRVVSYVDMVNDVKDEESGLKVEEVTLNTSAEEVQENEVSLEERSPSYMSEGSDHYKYHQLSQSGSVNSMSADSTVGSAVSSTGAGGMILVQPAQSSCSVPYGDTWSRAARSRYGSSDTGSVVSGEGRGMRRRGMHQVDRPPEPQQAVGVQYMEAAPYIVPVPVSVVVTPAQVHLQEQLQRKHEELQQMIVLQQQELRRVSEQLVMARFGILPPTVINVPYSEDTVGSQLPQITYEEPIAQHHAHTDLPPFSPHPLPSAPFQPQHPPYPHMPR